MFYCKNTIFVVYVDNGIFIGDTDAQILEIISQLQRLGLAIEDQGHPADYVGVNIKRLKGGGIEFTQRALIDSIIADVDLKGTTTKPVPAKAHTILLAHKDQNKVCTQLRLPVSHRKTQLSCTNISPRHHVRRPSNCQVLI